MFHSLYGRQHAFRRLWPALLVGLALGLSAALRAAPINPPYGDPNQAYDRLPGTFETFHVQWANPLAATPEQRLNVLFILPFRSSRQVVELAQRLELDYTAIMCAGHRRWDKGYFEGEYTACMQWAESAAVLADLTTGANGRLTLPGGARRYDAIVIGKVSWNVMPPDVRTLLLQHLSLGTGLVYLSPNVAPTSLDPAPFALSSGEQAQFDALFGTGAGGDTNGLITRGLPLDVMDIKLAGDAEYAGLPAPPKFWHVKALQQALTVRLSAYGAGAIVNLDYHDADRVYDSALTPETKYDKVKQDFDFAVLVRAVLLAAGKQAAPERRAVITFSFPPCGLPVPAEEQEPTVSGWDLKVPVSRVAHQDIDQARIRWGTEGHVGNVRLEYAIRDADGRPLAAGQSSQEGDVPLPMLPRGNYTAALRVLDTGGRVLDFAARSFRVEEAGRIAALQTDKGYYEPGEAITGTVSFSQALAADQSADAWAVDTWGRMTWTGPVQLATDRLTGTFVLPVGKTASRLWDICCALQGPAGAVDVEKTWVGLPNWNFDDYMMAFIFTTSPDYTWKGDMYTRACRRMGINANNVYLIYGFTYQYELNARYNLQSISYTEHLGQNEAPDRGAPFDQEMSNTCMAEFGRMARHVADTGANLDPAAYPYKWGQWSLGADWINRRLSAYAESLKFGSPYYWLVGETYLSGEFWAQENSCFCPLCTLNFQSWCGQQYNNDLAALNAEWNTSLADWSQVRGVLYAQAAAQNQLPRWVDFRHFMRSAVWGQFFIDWTDMLHRRLGRAVRTGTNGHDHYDFSRFRAHMTSGKLYGPTQQTLNDDWKDCVTGLIRESFSTNQSFLLGAQSHTFWNDDFKTALDQRRFPWKILFRGYRGFDWEAGGMSADSIGGFASFTPDYSEALPFFQEISAQVQELQRGIGKLANTAQPVYAPVAVLWSPVNHYIQRLLPAPPHMGKFSGTWLQNISVDGGAIADSVAMMRAMGLLPFLIAPEDLTAGVLPQRGVSVLLLPYSKGMSSAEADAIRSFVQQGGTVIADNEPGTYTEHGRPLGAGRRLADLFPDLGQQRVATVGLGTAAYMPNAFNGYITRFEADAYPQTDVVADPVDIATSAWTLVSHQLTVGNAQAATVGLAPRAAGDVTIDDLVVTKIPANKFGNPGLEEIRWESLDSGYFYNAQQAGCDLGTQNPAPIPANFDQFCGCTRFNMVPDAHSGSRALRFSGSFYFGGFAPIHVGETFTVELYAKGTGTVRIIGMVWNGALLEQMVPGPVPVNSNAWTLVTHVWTVTAPAASFLNFRPEASGDVIIDDIVVQRDGVVSIGNGGFEDFRLESLTTGYFADAVARGVDLGATDPARIPVNFEAFAPDCARLIIEESGAHSGTRALRFSGGFTLTDRLSVEDGDTLAVSYYVKGAGSVQVNAQLFDANGTYIGQNVDSLIAAAGVSPEVALTYAAGPRAGLPRRDTAVPVYAQGSARYFGLLKQAKSPVTDAPQTRVDLRRAYHVYDIRAKSYLGFTDTFTIEIDKEAKFVALLPANPTGMTLTPDTALVAQGDTVALNGQLVFNGGTEDEINQLGQVAHVTVRDPAGNEVACYRDNLLFTGRVFAVQLPVSFTEVSGQYTVKAELLPGLTAESQFTVEGSGGGTPAYDPSWIRQGTYQSNQKPTVTLTAPTDGGRYVPGIALTLAATAGDSDGSISTVQFFADGMPAGKDTTTPYSVTWTPSRTGEHAIYAIALDNVGASSISLVAHLLRDASRPTGTMGSIH